MDNIIIVKLDSTYAAVHSGIWQWNYGQILRIQGGNLPKVVEVHFSLQDKGGDSITRIGTTIDGATDVPIPDSFLENGRRAQDYKIYAFIYLEDGTAGNTKYKIEMSVKSRPKPEVPGTPEETEMFREAIKAVNDAAGRAETAEKSAEAWTHGNESYPERDNDNARYYAEQAKTHEENTNKAAAETENMKVDVENVASTVKVHLDDVVELKEQTQNLAEAAAISEQQAKESSLAAFKSLQRTEESEGRAELNAQKTENDKSAVEQAKTLVLELGQKVTEQKEAVDQTVSDFDNAAKQAVSNVENAGIAQKEGIQQEGNTQVKNVQAVVDGISTEATAQKILEQANRSLPLLELMAEASGKAGSLNGFGLEKGKNDTVVITYTNPETEVLEGTAVFPTNTTLARIEKACTQMCESLKLIALQKGADV